MAHRAESQASYALGLGHWYSPVSCMYRGPSRAGRPRAHDYAVLAAQYGTP